MKIRSLVFTAFCSLLALSPAVLAQGTAFTYQGRLNDAGAPVSGSYDMSFTLFTSSTGGAAIDGPVTNTAVNVTNGLFTTSVDFGSVLTGASNWLQIAVSTNGANAFTNLAPRQQLTPAPYALYAESANAAGLTGAIAGNGGGLTNLTASQLTSGTVADARLSTNVAFLNASQTFSGANNFGSGVGITGANTLQFGAGLAGQEASAGKIGYEHFTTNSLDIVGAGANVASTRIALFAEAGSVFSGPIGLGGQPVSSATGLMLMNSNNGAGNQQLWITEGSRSAPASNNIVVRITPYNGGSVGYIDAITTDLSRPSTLLLNPLGGKIGIGTGSPQQLLQVGDATVAGSQGMIRLGSASGTGDARTWDIGVPMTGTNLTGDGYSFVINDVQLGTNTPQFMVQYGTGNVGIGTATPTGHLSVQTGLGTVSIVDDQFTPGLAMTGGPVPGVLRVRHKFEMWPSTDLSSAGLLDVRGTNGIQNIILDGSTGEMTCVALNCTSDRNAKEHFKAVNARAVLEKVASLPITEWQYKQQSDARHIGPMAQDFHEAFTLGHDDKHISIVDEGGVALAAIKGLNEKLEEQVRDQETELTRIKSENQTLAGRLAAVERALGLADSATASK